MKRALGRGVLAAAMLATMGGLTGLTSPAAAVDSQAGDPVMNITVGDDVAETEYTIPFEKVYAGRTPAPDNTPIYIYVPVGWNVNGGQGVLGIDPNVDPNTTDDHTPCGGELAAHKITQETIDGLGDELADHVVAVDEAHFGPMGDANGPDEGGEELVALFYNVFDEAYYDCAEDSYTAGYYAPAFKTDYGMNVIVLDTNDFEEMTGSPETATDLTNEGVIAHELEHLLLDYRDENEVSWVNEGLADFAMFLNGYPTGGSHITYNQVFHRETSLTRWAGGLENYGAAYTFFQYLWERAGGNGTGAGAGQYTPDSEYDGVAGDLAIKMVFDEAANGMEGVQKAINAYNAANTTQGIDLPDVEELFKDWSLAIYLDDETNSKYDVKAVDIGSIDSQGWTIDIANDEFFKNRGTYNGATPEGRFAHSPHVPAQSALPFGTSYETFRNPGKTFRLDFSGPASVKAIPESNEAFWFGGTDSQSDHELNINGPVSAGQVVSFDSWYFIEDGWDYGYVEAKTGPGDDDWVTVPVRDAAGTVVSTNTNPQGNNDEGNGLTGTSGGVYFVDQPELQRLSATMPPGTTAARFRYSTDPAYVDTGWFVNDVMVGATPAALSSPDGEWVFTLPQQNNNWSVQVVSPCDLTPGQTIAGESTEPGRYIYRLSGSTISQSFTQCSTKDSFTVVISNLTGGALDSLDAPYTFRITNTAAKGSK
jgi:hypothetical protein